MDKGVDGFEKNKHVGTIFCDLPKAFDCVSHSTLLNKLKSYNFNINSLKLLSSYLSNCKQYVQINNNEFEIMRITYEVPQGSLLGPI